MVSIQPMLFKAKKKGENSGENCLKLSNIKTSLATCRLVQCFLESENDKKCDSCVECWLQIMAALNLLKVYM